MTGGYGAPAVGDVRNKRLEARLEGLGTAMYALGEAVDENLRTILLAMTQEAQVTAGLSLRDTMPQQEAAMETAVLVLGLQGPVASDLRWTMAMMRLAKDYERIADLTRSLMSRVHALTNSLHEETLRSMVGVMRAILRVHAVLLTPAKPDFRPVSIDWAAHEDAVAEVKAGLQIIEQRSVQALLEGAGSPEDLRELVLAARHMSRISGQLERMPRELEQLGAVE